MFSAVSKKVRGGVRAERENEMMGRQRERDNGVESGDQKREKEITSKELNLSGECSLRQR